MTLNNSEFNKVQLNESREIVDGKVIRSSILINVRCDDPNELIRLYQEVKTKLNGKEKEENPDGKQKGEVPYCDCGLPMALRQNKRKNTRFFSCQKWTPKGGGCGMTLPYPYEKKEIPIVEDSVAIL